jgi:hypothetical protein
VLLLCNDKRSKAKQRKRAHANQGSHSTIHILSPG